MKSKDYFRSFWPIQRIKKGCYFNEYFVIYTWSVAKKYRKINLDRIGTNGAFYSLYLLGA